MAKCTQPQLRRWTITLDFPARSDLGKPFRARSVIQVEAENIPSAYDKATSGLPPGCKLGSIMPGWHDQPA